MEVYRISTSKYASQLSASGVANRWNKDDEYVIYTGWSRSLSSLELVVHRASIRPRILYKVMIIELKDTTDLIKTIAVSDLPAKWKSISAYPILQNIGSAWYKSEESLILKVPSAIIPQEHNYIINTRHPSFRDKVKLIRTEDYFWDDRLL